MISLSRFRSFSSSILCDTPRWLTFGMKTRCLPGSEMWQVTRAPFTPKGSLAT